MMKSRLFVFLALVVLVAGLVPAVSAQEATPDVSTFNCLNLSEADCAILQASGEATESVTSFTPTYTFDFSIANAASAMPGMLEDTAFSAKGTGAVVIDHAAMSEDAPYNGVTASLNADTTDSKGSKSLSYMLSGGVLYWKDGADAPWKAAQMADLETAVQNGHLPNIGISTDSFGPVGGMMEGMGGMMGGMGGSDGSAPSDSAKAMMFGMDISPYVQIPGLIKQERLADTQFDGQTMQVFTYTGDLGILMTSEPFQNMVNEAMKKASAAAQQNPMAAQMMAYLPIMLESTTGTATFTRWIGADDHFTHHIDLNISAAMDLFGGTSNSKVTPIPPIDFEVAFAVDLTAINNTAAPSVPTDATMLSAEELVATAEATPAQ